MRSPDSCENHPAAARPEKPLERVVQAPRPASPMIPMNFEPPPQGWVVHSSHAGGRPVLVRHRSGIASWEPSRLYPVCFVVTWDYRREQGLDGLPELTTSSDMSVFEDEILRVIEHPQTAICVLIATHAGVREWLFYCVDLRRVMKAIEENVDTRKCFPVRFDATVDPSWLEYRKKLALVNK